MQKSKDAEAVYYSTSGLVSVHQIVDTTDSQVYYPNNSSNPRITKYVVKSKK